MTDSLRRGAIDAAVEAIGDRRITADSKEGWREFVVGLAIDALLDYLEAHIEEWDALLRWDLRQTELPSALLDALREGSISKEG